jgi:glyoxylase-like metal-dependent hydrolase (beta-lactamase superfamily II)
MKLMKLMEDLYLLKEGKVIRSNDVILYASSASVLILDEFPIIVDTAMPEDIELIQRSLAEAGIQIDEVKMVINTHLHSDHTGCNSFFKAEKYAHVKEIAREGIKGIIPLSFNNISSRVKFIETPGHTEGHISVVFESSEVAVIAGDAIPTYDNYLKRVPPRINIDEALAMNSFEKIERIADLIIPGHDKPFRVR